LSCLTIRFFSKFPLRVSLKILPLTDVVLPQHITFPLNVNLPEPIHQNTFTRTLPTYLTSHFANREYHPRLPQSPSDHVTTLHQQREMAATTAMKPPHMETPSQVAREGDAAETSRDQAVVPRQSYNTGHGDFCFGRLFDKDNLPGYELQSPNGEGSNFRANNVLFIEKDGFQRSERATEVRDSWG